MSDYISLDVRSLDVDAFPRFRVLVIDPPWWYADRRKERKDGAGPTRGIGACHHYEQMTTEEICALRIPDLADDRCHLYLWATGPLMADAFQVLAAWGFGFATFAHVWVKLNPEAWKDPKLWERGLREANIAKTGQTGWFPPQFSIVCSVLDKLTFKGPGFYTMSNAEYLLLGVKGRPFAHAEHYKIRQVIHWPRLEEHSRKPEIFQNAIQYMYPDVTPRVEVFARRARSDWTCIGNERLFDDYEYRDPADTELESS